MIRALDIYLGRRKIGRLFQYGVGATAITRLLPNLAYWQISHLPSTPVLSLSSYNADAQVQSSFWQRFVDTAFFNGVGAKLPSFFANLLPEGLLREHLAQIRGCAVDDDFELLAACGKDLPGNVFAKPAQLKRSDIAGFISQGGETLEASVSDVPIAAAASLSGVQPKLSLVLSGTRYVARTKMGQLKGARHIIAKLPTGSHIGLVHAEALGLTLAHAAGVNVCAFSVQPLSKIAAVKSIPFVTGDEHEFLAVERFDRNAKTGGHVHVEDFAQISGMPPMRKYAKEVTYANMCLLFMQHASLGLPACHELIRRLVANDLMGNYDAHLKNLGLIYRDGCTPELSPAYDIVPYCMYRKDAVGHALPWYKDAPRKERLTLAHIAQMCQAAHLPVALLQRTARETVRAAAHSWGDIVAASPMPSAMQTMLRVHVKKSPLMKAYLGQAKRQMA